MSSKLQPENPPIEEHDDNVGTGVEQEETDTESSDGAKPWDPDQIRVDPKTFSLRNLMDMIDEKELILAPDFQRRLVWSQREKSRLIESLLLRIPLPAFYFDSSKEGTLQVVDGLQRLTTIYEYVRQDAFALTYLEYLEQKVESQKFSDLNASWKRRVNQTQFFVYVIDPQTPLAVKFNIFKRINTGGKPLNPQEIRHAMGSEKSRNFLRKMTTLESFKEATNGALTDHKRMADREVALRFCAFRKHLDDYSKADSLDVFLTNFNGEIERLPNEDLDELRDDFDRAMRNAIVTFGDHAFRKWPEGDDAKNPINRALFESWAVALADCTGDSLTLAKDSVVALARQVMKEDDSYVRSISVGTGDTRNVSKRFSMARNILETVLS